MLVVTMTIWMNIRSMKMQQSAPLFSAPCFNSLSCPSPLSSLRFLAILFCHFNLILVHFSSVTLFPFYVLSYVAFLSHSCSNTASRRKGLKACLGGRIPLRCITVAAKSPTPNRVLALVSVLSVAACTSEVQCFSSVQPLLARSCYYVFTPRSCSRSLVIKGSDVRATAFVVQQS